MALTRKALKAMGLSDEQVDSVVEMHTETVDGLKEKLKTAEEKAAKFDDAQKELSNLKNGEDYKAKYEAERKAFADYKAEQTAKETKAAKERAVKAYLEGKKITGDNLDIALMAVSGLVDGLELDGDAIKDTTELDGLVNGKLARLVVKTSTRGARTETPPDNTGGGKPTKEEIMKIKDTSARQKAIAENIDLFRR